MRALLFAISLLSLFLGLSGCRPEMVTKNPYVWHKKDKAFFEKFVNRQQLPLNVDRQQVATLVNHEYPIEIALFENGEFFYHLENLGDGTGSWSHKDGQLDLYAERSIFVMRMSVHSIAENEDDVVIHFTDRFSTKYLALDFEPGVTALQHARRN